MQNVVRPTLLAMATTFGLGAESSRLPACNYYYPVPDRSGDGVLFSIDFFVSLYLCLFVSFFVSKIARKRLEPLDRFA